MAQLGVNYPNQKLVNEPQIVQAPLVIGNAGGTFTVQPGAPSTLGGAATIAGVNAAYVMSPSPAPGDVGLKAWTYPVKDAQGAGSAVTVTGTTYLASVHLTAGVPYGTVYLKIQANGGTASAGSNFAGLYNSAGNLVATSADISVALGTAGGNTGYITCPLSTAYTPPASGQHWVGVQFTAANAGSYPVFYTLSAPLNTVATGAGNGVGGVAGPNGAAPFPYSAVAGTTVALGLIPPSFTLGSAGTTAAYTYWAALS